MIDRNCLDYIRDALSYFKNLNSLFISIKQARGEMINPKEYSGQWVGTYHGKGDPAVGSYWGARTKEQVREDAESRFKMGIQKLVSFSKELSGCRAKMFNIMDAAQDLINNIDDKVAKINDLQVEVDAHQYEDEIHIQEHVERLLYTEKEAYKELSASLIKMYQEKVLGLEGD